MSARMPEGRLAYFQPRCTSIHSAWRHCARIRISFQFHSKTHCNVRLDGEQVTTLHAPKLFRKTTLLSMSRAFFDIREASRDISSSLTDMMQRRSYGGSSQHSLMNSFLKRLQKASTLTEIICSTFVKLQATMTTGKTTIRQTSSQVPATSSHQTGNDYRR